MSRGFDVDVARRALMRADPVLARWIRKLGPLPADPRWQRSFDLVDALARAILYQQLSGKAAATIVGRVEVACGSRRLTAAALQRTDEVRLRACGVSGNKQRALRDLAQRQQAGALPNARQVARASDEEVIAALVAVRGIGRWTAEMLLIFRLGRADIFPLDDLGIRRGAQRLLSIESPPKRADLVELGQRWAPWRTMASLYLWRIADA
jgi:DNA-3-methyladenine glycosylase II